MPDDDAPTKDRHSRTSTQFRLDPEVHDVLVKYAQEAGVSLNWVANRLLREALPYLRPATELRLTERPDP